MESITEIIVSVPRFSVGFVVRIFIVLIQKFVVIMNALSRALMELALRVPYVSMDIIGVVQ
jgi:hypothetical protein|tara:strand:+ start:297 stop:479 length:183 start_codon:yes stop_codon:yes gene_type:complete